MATFSVLTPAGRGAVATLRVRGFDGFDQSPSLFAAANGKALTEQPLQRVCFGRWGTDPGEEVVLCRIDSNVVEIHCHGGDAAVARISSDLEARGYTREVVPDIERGAADAETIEAECRAALSRATTLRTADILWQQCEGRLAGAFDRLSTLSPSKAAQRARELLRWAEFGRHLTQPWKVVLCGRPNVGKSSLINALVGYGRSIVFDQPGTTRDVVTVETALDGWPVELSDTAGLRENADELEAAGISRARRQLESADLRLLLVDISCAPHDEDRQLLEEWPDSLVVAHKSDRPNRWEQLPAGALAVSSLHGDGVEELAAAIVGRLIPSVPPPSSPIPVADRQIALLKQLAVPAAQQR